MSRESRKWYVRLAWIVAALTFVVVVAMLSRSVGDGQKDEGGPHKAVVAKVKNSSAGANRRDRPMPSLARRRPKVSSADSGADEDEDDMSPEDRKLADAIEKALDDEDLASARALAAQAMASTNTEIRQSMVDTLGWFGVKALPEITPFLADSDEDVRDSAQNEWEMAVAEIEDEAEKLGIVELAMNVLTDEDMLEDISNEYIGVDEKLAVESLLRIIESGGSEGGIAKARETYEFVTGEEFTDRAAAEKWIAEEYEPPEKE